MEGEGRLMEGWLYLIRSNEFGFQLYLRKRYYVLQNLRLQSFKSSSHSYNKDPIRNAIIHSSIHVVDNGRKSIRGKVFFIFTFCNTSNYGDHLKLGARDPEEAARWIKSFHEISLKVNQSPGNILDCVGCEKQYLRLNYSSRVNDTKAVDGIPSLASITDPKTLDIHEPSYWTIFGCHNGLRLFKQASDQEGHDKRDGPPAIAAVSVIDGTPEVIFQTLMSLGSSRSEWDFCFQNGNVIEKINGHTDIIHKLLNNDWLPRGMKQRDFVLQRNWRREDDGTYIILYHSVLHKMCPPQKGFVRAPLKCGGYVISPVNQYNQSLVRHMLVIDWKLSRFHLQKSSTRSLTIHMLGRLAALRELFKTNLANYLSSEFSSQEFIRDGLLLQKETFTSVEAQIKENDENKEVEVVKVPSDDESDEFFDFTDPVFDDQSESNWDAVDGPEVYSQDIRHVKSPAPLADVIVKEKHDCTVQRKILFKGGVSFYYRMTLPEDQTGNLLNSWSVPKPSLFSMRGETFLEDRKKIPAESTLMQVVAVDWLRSDKREDHLASRHGNIVQEFAADGCPEFFFVINFQVPGSTTYNLAYYYMTSTPIKDLPLLERFIEGDDAFKNSRLKIIPHVAEGPWILKQTVRRPTLIGNMLKINYIRGNNYLEIDIDVGSSAIARGVASQTFGYISNMAIDTAFVIQANTREELPEQLLGACRVNHLDLSKAVWTRHSE